MTKKKPWKLLLTLSTHELRLAAKAVGEATQAVERLRLQRQGLSDALAHYQQPDKESSTSATLLRNTSLFKKKLAAALESIELQMGQQEKRRAQTVHEWLACKAKKDGFDKLDYQSTQARKAELALMQDKAVDDTLASRRGLASPGEATAVD